MQLYTITDPQLQPDTARTLARAKKPEVRRAIAQNPNTPADALLSLIVEFPGEVLENPSLPLLLLEDPELLHKISVQWSSELAQILFHPSFPAELLVGVFLAQLRSLWAPKTLLCHPRCPKGLLLAGLHAVSNARLKEHLFTALLQHREVTTQEIIDHYFEPLEANTRVALGMCRATPPSMLAALLVDGNEQVRASAAANPEAPAERLRFLHRAGASDDLRRFTRPDTLTIDELSRLRVMGPFGEALWVRHPGTPPEEATFRHGALWLAALASRPDLPAGIWAEIKGWARQRKRRVTHLKEVIRAQQKAETVKKNRKRGKVVVRPRP